MARDRITIGKCPKCDSDELTCTWNHFERDDLVIDSWEHKCLNCGLRETTAWRTDDEDPIDPSINTQQCPYCQRIGKLSE